MRQLAATKVIVVEDSNALQTLLRSIVAKIAGLSVAGVFIGASTAIAAIRSAAPDILLLDIQLSEGNGVDVMRVVANEYPNIKVIVVTNFADPIYRKHFADAGAYAFFDKSFDLDAVRSTLEVLAGAARQRFCLDEMLAKTSTEEFLAFCGAPVESV